jgi:hypothetical protein
MGSDLGRNVGERGVDPRPMTSDRLSILLLCDDDPNHANTLLEHIDAIRKDSVHDVRTFNPRSLRGSRTLALREFDVVVIHYSLCIVVDEYVAPSLREKLRGFKGLKVQFIQDDYRWVNRIAGMMRDLGIGVLFTLVPPAEIPKVWSAERLPGVVKISTLAGYVPESLIRLPVRPLDGRPTDIGYRGRELPYWVGRLGQDKVRIAQGVLARVEKYGLRCDIAWAESDRIYGQAWNEFLVSCRTILGTESGASITDFDGSIEGRVSMYLAQNPGADFEEVHWALLREFEDNVRMNVISPRIFEAIALRTPMILFPGEYSGVIRPWVHYIPLEKDFSNMDEVVERLRDTNGLEAMRDRAYEDVVRSGRYSLRTFVREFDEIIERYAVPGRRFGKMWYYGALVERRVERAAAARLVRLRDRLRGSAIWDLTKRSVKACVALELALRYRDTRELLFRALRYREVRQAVRPGLLLKDLFRLCMLRKIRGGMRAPRDPFWVSVRLERTGVEFFSHPAAVKECGEGHQMRGPQWTAEIADSAIAAFHSGQFAVVWNHSALGAWVSYPLTQSKSVPIGMGGRGVHDFPAFRKVATHSPKQAGAIIAAVLNGDMPDSRT